jgi:drug/metabolite transporter (DMT)-like permease
VRRFRTSTSCLRRNEMGRAQANGLLFVAAFLWGIGNVAQKTVLEDLGPFTAVGFRCLIAALILAPFFARVTVQPSRDMFKSMSLVVLTFAVGVTLYQIATGLTTVTNAGFLVNVSIVVTPLFAWFLLKQNPVQAVWPAAALTILGAYMMSAGNLAHVNIGDGLAIAAALSYALWMIFLGRFVGQFGHAGFVSLLQFAVTGFTCLLIGFSFEPISSAQLISALPELLMLGVVSTGIGYLLQAVAQAHTSASEAAVIVSGEAIFGAACAFVFLGESLDAQGLLGAALILCGIGVVQLNRIPKIFNPARWRTTMKGYDEFKGYQTKMTYDPDTKSFAARKLAKVEVAAAMTHHSAVRKSKPVKISVKKR